MNLTKEDMKEGSGGEGKGLTRVPKRLDWKRMYSSVTYNLPMRFDENLIPERRR
jgi:hypothetical protein